MKKLLIALFATLFACNNPFAQQGVGIKTDSSTPHNSAMLDISSTSKGFLPPLLSQAARQGISNPAEGLLVYDTTTQRFYQYQDGIWRFIINSDYWTESTSRSAVFNISDSVCIGSLLPGERLDVVGDIRVRNNVISGSNITVGGTASGSQMHANGDLIASGTLLSGGNIIGNTDLVIDNASAILQLKTSGINKTFIQLNGDDLRMGTNSGNANGDIIFRLDGNDVLKADANANVSLLKYFGNLDYGKMVIGKSVTRPLSSGNALTILYGRIFSDGSEGAMWPATGTSVKISTGVYDIDTHMTGVSSKGTIIVTASGIAAPRLSTGRFLNTTKFRVEIFNLQGAHVDTDFYFMINDPLN